MNSYTIRLDKNRHGYGLTITGERPCILSSIQQGSPADRAGLKVGDCLVSINDISVKNATHDKVVYMVGSSNCLVLQVTRRLNVDIKNDLKLKNNFIRKASKKYILPRSNTQILNPIGNLGEFTDMAKTEGLTNDNLKVFPFKRNLSVSSRRNRVMYRENVKRENSRVNLATTKRLSQNKRNKIRYLDQQRQVSGDTKISFKSGPIDKEHYSRNIFFVDRPVNFKNNEKTKEFLENRQNIQKAHSSAPATNLLHVYKVIVGYIGTTQLPMSSMFRKFTIQDSVKRLDALKCNYTLMALLLSTQEIRFINSIGKYIAKYSLEDIAYIGRYELDTKFFGIITQNSNTNKYESKSLKSTFPSNNSTHVDCHIFYTDRSLALNHEQHSIIAKKFAFKSTKILQSDNKNSRLMDRICCQEFTLESTPILVNVIKILENYKSKYSKDKLNEKKSMSHINSDSSLNQIQKNIKRIQIGCDNSSEDSSWDSRTGWYNGMLPMEDITTSSLTSFGSSGNNAVEQQWRGFAEKQKLNNLRKHIRSQPLPQSEKNPQLDIDKQLDQDWKIANDQVKSSNSLDLCKMPKNSHFIEKPKITDNWKKSFDCLLNDSIGIKIFTYFLKLEFSEENIKFWISCNEYKNSIQNEVCRKKIGKYIFDTYICQNGIEAININDDTRSAISLNKIYECSNECVLNQAQSEIYTLMKMDSYCRFVTSDIFQDCVNSEKRGEAISIPVKPASLTNLLNQCKVANPTESRRRSLLHWPKALIVCVTNLY
ncbi:hypothetical protein A3Q56_06696 [Intoshia linei]|uniref:Regulator of G-protein signaling 12 n=1 Tax=Intoshia linei TaxID=1819745 RepID=A0A177AWM5_9BILA|nr:hypothetical protein A3Q56_06696 [Intoshia linei]